MKNVKYSLYLNEFRKNLAAHGKLLLRCDFLAGYSMPGKSRLDSEPR